MNSEKNRLIIFNTNHDLLGEMIFEHDLFLQANLHPNGEEILGGWLEDWQVQGILYFYPEANSTTSISTVGEYISLHDPVFPSALRQWLERHGIFSILLNEDCLKTWYGILSLPLLPKEQFTLGQKLSVCKKEELEKFDKSLDKIIAEMEKSQKVTKPKTPVKPKVTKKSQPKNKK